eukprot:1421482-Prymnesium_polylepis.1
MQSPLRPTRCDEADRPEHRRRTPCGRCFRRRRAYINFIQEEEPLWPLRGMMSRISGHLRVRSNTCHVAASTAIRYHSRFTHRLQQSYSACRQPHGQAAIWVWCIPGEGLRARPRCGACADGEERDL